MEIHEVLFRMQMVVSSSDVVLAWSLQSALAAGLAISCAGLAVTFRRPAMRVLAVFWTLLMVASVFIWAALSSQSLGLPASAGSFFAALAFPLTPVLAFVLLRHLLLLLRGRAARAFPSARLLVTTGAGALGLSLVVQSVTAPSATQSVAPVMSILSSAATIVGYAILAVIAARAFGKAKEHRAAIRLLGASFALLAIRSATNFVVAAISAWRGEAPKFGVAVTTVQILLLVIAGVLQLIAVLDEERASILRQAEQLREAEVSMAASQRLESLGRMAGAVAHDFNNILTVISVSAGASAANQSSEALREDLQEITTSVARGKALTDQLLAFARSTPQQVTRFDARAQVEKLRVLLERLAGDSVNLSIGSSPSLQLVDMDVTQFEQVVMNLVLNARDAIPPGGRIAVQIGAEHPDGSGRVRISVEDTGSGIPPDVMAHIFEPFYSTKRESGGTGLGLAICDGIVRAAGGHIVVDSTPGKGTRFDVLLRRATEN